MSVIKAAYRMKVDLLKSGLEDLDDGISQSELEWAYSELADVKKRNIYRANLEKVNAMPSEASEARPDAGKMDLNRKDDERKNDVWSVLLSTGLFLMMIGAIGYGLYLVGAVRSTDEYGYEDRQNMNRREVSATLEMSVVVTDMPVISLMHTATVEALKVTATHESLVIYSDGLTATNHAKNMPTPTPTMVLVQACPNAVSVNVRTGPSTAYSALGQILMGDCITITGRNEDSSWLIITDSPRPSMNDGWVSSELMEMKGSGEDLEIIYLD
jgi:hypothetical protein